jgi:hypothetical protein
VETHLIKVGNISGIEAESLYRIRSLTSRISEIRRRKKLKIDAVWKKDLTGQRYVRYYLNRKAT